MSWSGSNSLPTLWSLLCFNYYYKLLRLGWVCRQFTQLFHLIGPWQHRTSVASPCWLHSLGQEQDINLWKSGEFRLRYLKGDMILPLSEVFRQHKSANAFWWRLEECWRASWPCRQRRQHSWSTGTVGNRSDHPKTDYFKLSYWRSWDYCHRLLSGTRTMRSMLTRLEHRAMRWPRTHDTIPWLLANYRVQRRFYYRIRHRTCQFEPCI